MLGLFGIQTNTASANHWYSDNEDFRKAWEKITRRLFWVFGNRKAPRAVLLEYNGFNCDGIDTDATYANSCNKESNTSQAYNVQFDHIS